MHFTPTYDSWLSQIELWLALLTQRAIKRKIMAYCEHYRESPKPFVWVVTVDSIFETLECLCTPINGTHHG